MNQTPLSLAQAKLDNVKSLRKLIERDLDKLKVQKDSLFDRISDLEDIVASLSMVPKPKSPEELYYGVSQLGTGTVTQTGLKRVGTVKASEPMPEILKSYPDSPHAQVEVETERQADRTADLGRGQMP